MEFPMQCRLCLSSGPAEAFVSIHGNPQPHLAESISSCCQLQVKKDDKLPDTICRPCNDNLELLISFRTVCLRNDEISKLKLNKRLNIKPEEVLLEDLKCENEYDVNSPPNVNNTRVNDQMKENLYKCDICSESFTHKSQLTIHKRTHGEKPYQCDICLKSFTRKCYFVQHKLIHTGAISNKCDICSKLFTHKSSLTKHKKTHAMEKPFPCDICSKSFSEKSALVIHKTYIHTVLKPYKCDICSKSFTHKSKITIHKRSHTGEKPYQCDICSKTFIEKGSLVRHIRTRTCSH
ncbi:uncharacterized protein LOC143921497 [Arctopsyche grandis]|uniref:uncharacterized protein LOC143921497 n=1 Tax=Arctopsyche grandis TaxID=121162 RepID=UPI00406DA0FB